MKNNRHFNYLKSFNYKHFFIQKTYQYFKPLKEGYVFIKNKIKNVKMHRNYLNDIGVSIYYAQQGTLYLIQEDVKFRLGDNNLKERKHRITSTCSEISTVSTSYIDDINPDILNRMSKVLVAA